MLGEYESRTFFPFWFRGIIKSFMAGIVFLVANALQSDTPGSAFEASLTIGLTIATGWMSFALLKTFLVKGNFEPILRESLNKEISTLIVLFFVAPATILGILAVCATVFWGILPATAATFGVSFAGIMYALVLVLL